jgi:acyl dehydratase
MSAAAAATNVGVELVSEPYLLDEAAAKAYHDGIERPPLRRARRNIHEDDDAARKAGFLEPIAGGGQTIAIVAQFLANNFGLRFVRGGRIEVSLTRPVFYGDTLISHAKIVSADPRTAQLQIHVDNQRGEQVLIGSATIRMSE